MNTVALRLITDKPVKKTAYQVKGVFIKHFRSSTVVPMLDGRYRNKFLYPRVQVKILNEQIYIVGINEGADAVSELAPNLKSLNFGNITFEVLNVETEDTLDNFEHIDHLLNYKFVSPWVALGNTTQNRYKYLKDKDRTAFLNKLLGQNIVFLGRELGADLNDKLYTKIRLKSLAPKSVDENGWGAFEGEFQTNFSLPDYIGIGNGITRGYGTILGTNNNNASKMKLDEIVEEDDTIMAVNVKSVPKPKRRSNKSKNTKVAPKKKIKHKRVKPNIEGSKPDQDSDNKFNTAEYHKKQHKI